VSYTKWWIGTGCDIRGFRPAYRKVRGLQNHFGGRVWSPRRARLRASGDRDCQGVSRHSDQAPVDAWRGPKAWLLPPDHHGQNARVAR